LIIGRHRSFDVLVGNIDFRFEFIQRFVVEMLHHGPRLNASFGSLGFQPFCSL